VLESPKQRILFFIAAYSFSEIDGRAGSYLHMISVLQTVYQTNNDSPIIRVGDSCTDVIIFMCYSFSKKFFGYSVRIPAQQACEERDMAIDKVREFFAGTELEGKIIVNLAELSNDFEKHRNIEVEYGGYCYLLHIEEYRMKGEEKPYDLARHEIINLLANNRKVEFMNKVKKDLYNQSMEMGRIKYYHNETMQTMADTVHHADDSHAAGGTR
jgi:hypothetical protein